MSLSLNDRAHCCYLPCAPLHSVTSYNPQAPCWARVPESIGESGPVVPPEQPRLINQAHTDEPLCTGRGKLPRKHPWRDMQLARLRFRCWASRMTSELPTIWSPRFAGAFSHLRGRSQTHSGLHTLDAYWKPTGSGFRVWRINYVICEDSKRRIFFPAQSSALSCGLRAMGTPCGSLI